ncbi:LysR family transcriptional regulator [Martelella sp. HB161492]|uniref:LysR family transcriptional regulator n=1 Tax=Martelella sp. HB161492 TaxID=2720726 RepID=UPI0015913472|nr:LysR family transcriptional regulator [Martelella sp. HB161492]
MNTISIKKMWVFVTVVDSGSFSEGAKNAFITQPAAASIIDEIESTVGKELFVRNGKNRRAILTEKGQEAYDVFVRALTVYDEALSTLLSEDRKLKKQKIMIQSPYVDIVSATWLNEVLQNEQQTRLMIEQGSWRDIINALEDRQDCIALLDGDVKPKHGEFISLGQIEMVLALPQHSSDPALNDARDIDWEYIPENTIIFSGICPQTLQQVYSRLRAANHLSMNFTEIGSTSVLRSCLEKSNLPALVPRSLIPSGPGEIRYLPLSSSKVFVPLGLYIPHGNSLRKLFSEKASAELILSESLS